MKSPTENPDFNPLANLEGYMSEWVQSHLEIVKLHINTFSKKRELGGIVSMF